MGPLLLFLCSHFLNMERPWCDTTVSTFCCARASGGDVAGGAANDCDVMWDGPVGGISSSWEWPKEARDRDSGSVNTETRRDQSNHPPRHSRMTEEQAL